MVSEIMGEENPTHNDLCENKEEYQLIEEIGSKNRMIMECLGAT
jgi:hypothetical protein